MKSISELLFYVLCFCFSAALLMVSLLGEVRLAALGDELGALERDCAALKTEIQHRRVDYEELLRLEEIERYAVEKLGLQHCSPGQIVAVEDGAD